ncbi:MAG: hypothetical protein WD005_05810 [Haliea sp.]
MLLSNLLERMISIGTLRMIDADGKFHEFAGENGPKAVIRLHDRSLHHKLFFNPELYLGEAYMDGTLTVEEGTLSDVLAIAARNLVFAQNSPFYSTYARLSRLMRRWQQHNPVNRARTNVAHH